MENPEKVLNIASPSKLLENKQDSAARNFYKSLESIEELGNVPKRSFSNQTESLKYQLLYSKYYQELVDQYEGKQYSTQEFESYIIEAYLRRKNK